MEGYKIGERIISEVVEIPVTGKQPPVAPAFVPQPGSVDPQTLQRLIALETYVRTLFAKLGLPAPF